MKFLKYFLAVLFLLFSCGKEKSKEIILSPSLFSEKITFLRDIHVRNTPTISSNIISSVLKGEKFPVVELSPSAIYIKGNERQGWCFINKNNIKILSPVRIKIEKDTFLYSNIFKSNRIGLLRVGAVYHVEKVVPSWCKIRLDNQQEGWVYIGSLYHPWINELNITNFLNLQTSSNKNVPTSGTKIKNQPTSQSDKRLILWNKLGSQEEVEHSVVGCNGKIIGNVKFVEGKFGKGALFGTKTGKYADYIIFPSQTLSEWSKFTMEIWFKSKWTLKNGAETSDYRHHCFFSANSPHSERNLLTVHAYKNGILNFEIRGNHGQKYIQTKLIGWASDTWHHIAIVYDKNGIGNSFDTMRIYLDGKIVANDTGMNTMSAGAKIMIGNWLSYNPDYGSSNMIDGALIDRPFNGVLDNFKIYNYAKTNFFDRFIEQIN